jgi:hypothetical protein
VTGANPICTKWRPNRPALFNLAIRVSHIFLRFGEYLMSWVNLDLQVKAKPPLPPLSFHHYLVLVRGFRCSDVHVFCALWLSIIPVPLLQICSSISLCPPPPRFPDDVHCLFLHPVCVSSPHVISILLHSALFNFRCFYSHLFIGN